VAAGEFTGDHKRDLFVVSRQSGWLLVGNDAGGFTPRQPNYGFCCPSELVVADLNADRKDDVAVLNESDLPYRVDIRLGDGQGRLSRPRTVPFSPFGVYAFALGRFNRDRWPDLAAIAINLNKEDAPPRLHVLLGSPRGPIERGGRFDIGRNAVGVDDVVAADFDGDRKQDLAAGASAEPARSPSAVNSPTGHWSSDFSIATANPTSPSGPGATYRPAAAGHEYRSSLIPRAGNADPAF
jgi:hypothetical protein